LDKPVQCVVDVCLENIFLNFTPFQGLISLQAPVGSAERYPHDLFSLTVGRNRALTPCFSCFQDKAIAQPAPAAIASVELSLAVT
jgi:aminoglycoside phosphotransferase